MTPSSTGTVPGHLPQSRLQREALRFLREELLPAASRSENGRLVRQLGRVVEGGALEELEALPFTDRQEILSFLEGQLVPRHPGPGARVVVDLVGHLTRPEQNGLKEPHRRPVLPAR